jgi:uracil-DNA glycosylase family 4
MTLVLDKRRVAMLAEFGVHLPPAAAMPPGPDPAPLAPAVQEVPPLAPLRAAAKMELAPRATGVELMAWEELAETVAGCRACKLCGTRRNTVFGVGDPHADWLIVGEAPGESEDAQGEPFVGQAGKLLDNMLRALGLSRGANVYIANVLKCRPPGNRNPEPDEVAQCEPFLRRQVALLQPKVIVAMGRFAVQSLLGTTDAIGKLRGERHAYAGVPVVVTYHPAYLLRNLPDKSKAWADLCLAREIAAES